jgi:queuine tRNA-ribosyltransferase accessory subunit
MEISAYIEGITQFRPDIAVGIADIEHGKPTPGLNRKEKMDERTLAWVRGLQNQLQTPLPSKRRFTSLWPPILPIEYELQRSYLEYLEEQPATSFGGITLYSTENLPDIPKHILSLPRLVLSEPSSPHAVLTSISLGADLLTIPFINAASEAGHAFTFSFPPSASSAPSRLPLSVDLWSPDHAAALEPLVPQCPCYACTNHHRAYIHHLLNANEMLAWVLLQLHNHHVMESFFTGIRASLKEGTFVDNADRFRRVYESEFPPFSGHGPRIRGYHAASKGGGEPKRNKAAYRKLEADREKSTALGNGREKTGMRDEGVEKVQESVKAGLFGEAGSEEQSPFDQLYDTGKAESSKPK